MYKKCKTTTTSTTTQYITERKIYTKFTSTTREGVRVQFVLLIALKKTILSNQSEYFSKAQYPLHELYALVLDFFFLLNVQNM